MVNIFRQILDLSITASWVILAVMAVRLLLRKAPKVFSYALWIVVAFRLVSPVSFQSPVSLFNLRPFREAAQVNGQLRFVPEDIGQVAMPELNTGLTVVDDWVNSQLPAATPQASINPMQILIFAGAVIWLIGMAVMAAISMVNYIRLRKSLRFAVRMEGDIWQCETVRSPFLVGLMKPRIYLPYGLDDQTRSYILAHENYHLKRLDHIAKLMGYALLTVHWFNPLCHLAFRMMNRDMEMSCDEQVLSRNNIPTTQYSLSLLTIATNRRFPAATPLAFAETGVKERMINVLNWKKPKAWVSVVAVLVCAVLLISCATNPVASKPDVSQLEFPGIKWGMSPDEVKSALNIGGDKIISEEHIDFEPYEDEFRLTISGSRYFGADAENLIFRFWEYNNKVVLWGVQVTYPSETNMTVVRDGLIEVYGPGTDYGFTNYELYQGSVQSYIDWNHSNNIEFGKTIGENAKNPKPTDEINHRWASTAKGSKIISSGDLEMLVKAFGDDVGTYADRGTVMEYLDKKVLITIRCRDGYTVRNIEYRPSIVFTAPYISQIKSAYESLNN